MDHLNISSIGTVPLFRWIPRQKDGESLYIHYNGGIRAARIPNDRWVLEPVRVQDRPASFGNFSRSDLGEIGQQFGLTPLAFQHSGWNKGSYYTRWIPIIPGKTNHMIGAADLWRNISNRISERRVNPRLSQLINASDEQIAQIIDDQQDDEKLPQFIALSLRGMDISVEEISAFYYEQLVDLMATNNLNGERVSSTQDQLLYTHVHSFFLHAGAARDYLAAFIAMRVGEDPAKADSLASLCRKLRARHFNGDSMLNTLVVRGVVKESQQRGQWETGGWMKELSELRNIFTHRRPYGSLFAEKSGTILSLSEKRQLYRYRRPIQTQTGEDVFDLIVKQYRRMIELFYDLAKVSGLNSDITVITDDDVIEFRSPKDRS